MKAAAGARETDRSSDALSAPRSSGKYDAAERRSSVRKGRERGCWVYVPLDELAKTGMPLDGPPPAYRVWGASRGRVVIQLYKER